MCTRCVQCLCHSSWGHSYTLCLFGLKISTRVSKIQDQQLMSCISPGECNRWLFPSSKGNKTRYKRILLNWEMIFFFLNTSNFLSAQFKDVMALPVLSCLSVWSARGVSEQQDSH